MPYPTKDKKNAATLQANADNRNKIYEFELIQTHERYQGVDKKTGTPVGPPYPPYFGIANSGIAINPKSGLAENWRYIEGQPSIWVNEQKNLEKATEKEVNTLLGQEQNQISFRKGQLRVRGNQAMLLEALKVQDIFEGNSNPYQQKPKVYRLNNPDAIVADNLVSFDIELKAMKIALESSDEDMVTFAYVLGIDTEDTTDTGLKRIRRDFTMYSKTNPAFFVKQYGNPENNFKYYFNRALKDGVLSTHQMANKLTWAESQVAIMDINSTGDVVLELSTKAINKDEKTLKVYEELYKNYNS